MNLQLDFLSNVNLSTDILSASRCNDLIATGK